MAYITDYNAPDHLQEIFRKSFATETILAGELERLRAIEREAKAISDAISRNAALERTFVQGSVLRTLFRLVGREMALDEEEGEG